MAVETIGGDPSMIKMMEEQGKTLEKHDNAINVEILPRLEILEKEHQVFKQEMTSLKSDLINVQKGQKELEVTVMKDGKETRDLLKPFADHVLRQVEFEAQTEKEVVIKKLDRKEKAVMAFWGAVGTGGLATIVAAIIALLQGGQ